MRVAGVLMMAIGLLMVGAALFVVVVLGWSAFVAQGVTMMALYGLIVAMGAALIFLGARTGFPKP